MTVERYMEKHGISLDKKQKRSKRCRSEEQPSTSLAVSPDAVQAASRQPVAVHNASASMPCQQSGLPENAAAHGHFGPPAMEHQHIQAKASVASDADERNVRQKRLHSVGPAGPIVDDIGADAAGADADVDADAAMKQLRNAEPQLQNKIVKADVVSRCLWCCAHAPFAFGLISCYVPS